MEEKDKIRIAESLALTMPISNYKSADEWYADFKKVMRSKKKNANKKQTKKKK